MDSRQRAICTKEARMVVAMAIMAAAIFLSVVATGSAAMDTSPHSKVKSSERNEADARFLADSSFRRILQAGTPFQAGTPPGTSTSISCTSSFGGKDIVFQNCNALEGEFALRWNVTSATTVTISFSQQHTGWIGFGLSPTGEMVGSSAVCGFPSPGGANVYHYFLGAQSREGVKPPGKLTVSDMKGEFEDGEMRLMFNLELTPEQMSRTGTLWAKGEHRTRTAWKEGDQGISEDPTLTEHNPFNSYKGFVSFGTGQQVGQTTVGTRSSSLKNAHGVLNALAWGVLIPIGAITARYAKVHASTWFYTHIAFQSLGFVIGVIGFTTGKISNQKSKGEYPTHCNIAIAILVFSSLQVVAGVFRPHKDAKIRWAWNFGHHWGGRLLIMLAIINVYIGLDILKPGTSWVTAYSFIVLVLGTSTLLLEIKKLWQSYIAPEQIKKLDRVLTSLHVNVEDQRDEDDAHGPKL